MPNLFPYWLVHLITNTLNFYSFWYILPQQEVKMIILVFTHLSGENSAVNWAYSTCSWRSWIDKEIYPTTDNTKANFGWAEHKEDFISCVFKQWRGFVTLLMWKIRIYFTALKHNSFLWSLLHLCIQLFLHISHQLRSVPPCCRNFLKSKLRFLYPITYKKFAWNI